MTVVLSLPVLNQPFGRDQGIFATIADTINRGGLPYRDAWDHKPPGIDYTYALVFRLFGRSWSSVHLLELVLTVVAMVGLWSIVRRWSQSSGLAAAGLLGMFSVLGFEWWDRGQAEMVIAALSTIGIALVLAGRDRSGWRRTAFIVTGGLILGALLWFKQTAAPIAVVAVAALWIHRNGRTANGEGGRSPWPSIILVLLSVVIGSALPAAWFFVAGAFSDLWEATISFNTLHIQTGANFTLDAAIVATVEFLGRMTFLTPLAAVGGWVQARRMPRLVGLLGLWLTVALVGVWVQAKFFSYHWSVALPPLAALAGLGIGPIVTELRRPGADRPIRWAIAGLAALVFGQLLAIDQIPKLSRDLPFLLRQTSNDQYQAQFGHNIRGQDVYSLLASRRTGEYLRERTRPEDTVLVWGFQALVNWLADRPAPTRFIFSYPLTIDRPESAFRRTARATFLSEFDAARPAYIVIVTKDVNPIQPVDSAALVESFPAFRDRLQRDYQLERVIEEFRIYRRKGEG